MSDLSDALARPDFDHGIGLCSVCAHQRVVQHPRGGAPYRMCRRTETDKRFRKFPPLPVANCPGFELSDESK